MVLESRTRRCSLCDAGTYLTTLKGVAWCAVCPEGKTSFTNSTSCAMCMADWYRNASLVTTTPTTTPSAIMSKSEKPVSPKVVSKMTLAEQLTAAQQTSVRSGYAATGVPMENVEMVQDARRAVSYTVTVFVKDSAAAEAVMTKLIDTAALKSALKDAVPDPRTIVCGVCVCVCVCVCAFCGWMCVCALGHTD